jgi:polygalacturonase
MSGFIGSFNIHDFGAVGDGVNICTDAFAAAIKAASEVGGGTVYVPAGTYLTGSIRLKSNINLYLDAGATVLFSTNKKDYPVIFSRWEGVEREVYQSCIYGANLENVSITGYGILNGQGQLWWELYRSFKKYNNNALEYPRPKLISFDECNKVLIQNVKLVNSPSWTINPICCENITIDNITVKNPWDSPTTDAIDLDSSKNIHISNCYLDVGDDCIVIKSGTEEGIKRVPCENITITNCTMIHGHGGVVIGSEMSGGVRNVVISNCIFEGTDRGIRIKSRRRRGGVVEDIRVNNIIMKNVISPIIMHMFYYCGPGGKDKYTWDKGIYPINDQTPIFRRIHISNITAREVRAAAGYIYGLPEMPIEDITFDNIDIHMTDKAIPEMPAMMDGIEPMSHKGFYCQNVKDIQFNNVTISNHEGSAFIVENGENIEFTKCRAKNPTNTEMQVFDLRNVL